jgi:small-conductance mechanosensitive channel
VVCIGCGKQIQTIESEYICDECFSKIKGTPAENALKIPDKFFPPIIGFLELAGFFLLILSLVWYFYFPEFMAMKLLFIIILTSPVILHAILTIRIIKTVQNAPELRDRVKRNKILFIKEIIPNILAIVAFIFIGIYLYEIWVLFIYVLTWIWSQVSGFFT